MAIDDASALPELYHCRLQLPVPPCAFSDLAKHKCIRSSSLVNAVTVLVCCCSYPCCGLGALHHHMLLLLLLLPPAPQQQRASELHCAVKLPLQAALRVAHAASLNGLVELTLLRCILKDELVLVGTNMDARFNASCYCSGLLPAVHPLLHWSPDRSSS